MLEDKIKEFLTFNDGFGGGGGSGYGFEECNGNGRGYSYGSGYSSGSGYSTPANEDNRFEPAVTNGYGVGHRCGFGLKSINGNTIHIIDNMPTIITSIHNNVAKGFIVLTYLELIPCYIVREGNKFAHGDTLRNAFDSLQEKLYDDSTEEERINAFKKKFPEYDVKYNNKDLFTYHHVLTGSCKMGRETFVLNNGLSLDGKTSVREFIKLTKNSYGGDIIKKLPTAYGIKQLITL